MAEPSSGAGRRATATAARRRISDRALLIVLAVAGLTLALTVALGLIAARNPTPPPLSVPSATSR